ncbi:DALR anticodon-binding domain-containing protein [Streptomyces cocklensis]|uniref:arginine--tRNA ligase n=1 Tax=Actinacidiphila cocklensis TaxID=887465 RepID=A0A9W4GR16_9ACTN|nr:DALR anticodon-binding domain-containing protein [Actinacidiphila cocklensis]MDD1060299.1 DALR anticodon-binding domain-containing protein [Actinacidiphila cocklensis]WSX76723.1 DALR anticodon-binding domain-containing protein [Streptomyces sp. NBC_00899]CAG6394204.1 Arginine--tRNA ligase [Actinacidiphila cocklensis]
MTPAELSWTVLSTVRHAVGAGELRVEVPEKVVVQRPPRPGCGDYATNVALQLAGQAGLSPFEVAKILAVRLAKEPGIAQVEAVGAGFLNITLSARAYADVVRQVCEQGPGYGRGNGLADESVTVVPEPPHAVRATLVAEVVNGLLAAAGARPGGPREALTVAEPDTGHDPEKSLGRDATRWALLRPPAEDTPRLTLALLDQREANPLFRVRYAHSRTRALLRNAHDLGVRVDSTARDPYRHPAETELLGLIADLPRVVETAARRRAPDRLARHLERLADAYLRFQDECPALPKGDEKPSAVHAARVRLADATGIVLADGLHLLGISAPDHL